MLTDTQNAHYRRIATQVAASIEVKRALAADLTQVAKAAQLLVEVYEGGGKALFFGNGGSAADAQHLAAELTGRFSVNRRPLPALALDSSAAVTAIGNDYGYKQVFARQLSALARPGDAAVALSTSGRSENVLVAIQQRAALGIRVITLTGRDPSAVAPWSDIVIAVPSTQTPRIQECHMLIGHILCDAVDQAALRSEDT